MPASLKESARMISGLQPRLHQTSLKYETSYFFTWETPIFAAKLNYCFSLQAVLAACVLALAQPASTKSRGVAPAALIPINENYVSPDWLPVHAWIATHAIGATRFNSFRRHVRGCVKPNERRPAM